MDRITRIVIIIVIALVLLFISPCVFIGYDMLASAIQKRILRNRSDLPQIAAACVIVAQSMTKSELAGVDDFRVPKLLRSLSPRHIMASTNQVTMEFHGGFDHYGYRLRQSNADPRVWTLSFYAEGEGEKVLTTIIHN